MPLQPGALRLGRRHDSRSSSRGRVLVGGSCGIWGWDGSTGMALALTALSTFSRRDVGLGRQRVHSVTPRDGPTPMGRRHKGCRPWLVVAVASAP